MVRDKYSTRDMGPFSDWHREELNSYYPFTDIDYVGYQNRGREIYILLETKNVPKSDFEPLEPKYPPQKQQLRTYWRLARVVGAPAFVVWHTPEVTRFKIDPIKKVDGEIDYLNCERVMAKGKTEFMDFLDRHRPEAKASANIKTKNTPLSEYL